MRSVHCVASCQIQNMAQRARTSALGSAHQAAHTRKHFDLQTSVSECLADAQHALCSLADFPGPLVHASDNIALLGSWKQIQIYMLHTALVFGLGACNV